MFLYHTSTRWCRSNDNCSAYEKYFQSLCTQTLLRRSMIATVTKTTTLPVMEHFYTLQGEGFHQGKAAYFIRLGGCDVGCVWCDVKDSWDAGKHPLREIQDLITEVKKHPGQIVVITGGEPLMHELTELTDQLHGAGLKTHIETSGSSPLSGNWDWITLSPKKF